MSIEPHFEFAPESPYDKPSYRIYREKFLSQFPFEEVIGKINPYTDLPVMSVDDYDLYCFSHYLKDISIDAHKERYEQIQQLSKDLDAAHSLNGKLMHEINILQIVCVALIVAVFAMIYAYFCF